MSAIKSDLIKKFDVVESVLQDFPDLEVSDVRAGVLVEGQPDQIDAFIVALKEQNEPGITTHHSMLFPDMVAVRFTL